MKPSIPTAFALAALATTAARAQQDRFQQEAMLIFDKNTVETVWIGDANETQFLYYSTEAGVDSDRMRMAEVQSIWLMEPETYREAMELYQGKRYEQALEKFAQVREEYRPLVELKDNHSSLAALYQMECLRKLDRLDELQSVRESFLPVERESLSREHHLRQLELYTLWDAVHTQNWGRLEILCRQRLEEVIPGYQRAQVGYCLGLALEGQDRPMEAINAYNIAMTADTAASEVLAEKAALHSLRLYTEDEGVQQAIRFYGTPDEDPNSAAAQRLGEAASLASLYELTLGNGKALPEEYKSLLKYVPGEDS